MIFGFLLYLFLGILPSIIWLCFYLQKDVHPEPKQMIIKIFIYGMILAIGVAFLEYGSFLYLDQINFPYLLKVFLYFFVCVAFLEEFAKYLIFRFFVQKNTEFDEPIDAMIYMIIISLGFVATENIFVLFPGIIYKFPLEETIFLAFLRFISATLVHALSSANIGFFASVSFFKNNSLYLLGGLLLSTLFHGAYNLFIKFFEVKGLFLSFLIIVFLFVIILVELEIIKKLKSVCKI